jgi:hypothetical protein
MECMGPCKADPSIHIYLRREKLTESKGIVWMRKEMNKKFQENKEHLT